MLAAGSILTLLALISLVVGLFLGVFWKGRRKQGWVTAALSAFLVIPVGLTLVSLDSEYKEQQQNRSTMAETAAIIVEEELVIVEMTEPLETASETEPLPQEIVSTEVDQQQLAMIEKIHGMNTEIVNYFLSNSGVVAQPFVNGGELCREDNFCAYELNGLSVRLSGAGIVEVQNASHIDFDVYRETCASVLSAISNTDFAFSLGTITGALVAAIQTERQKFDLNGVQIDIRSNSTGTPSCRFFKY